MLSNSNNKEIICSLFYLSNVYSHKNECTICKTFGHCSKLTFYHVFQQTNVINY